MNQVVIGDCRVTLALWAAEGVKVQCVVTSPPYFGLRDYGVEGQIGLEKTPEEYVSNLVDVFRLVRGVLADDGVLWLNLGDSYANDGKWGGSTGGKHVESLHGHNGSVGRGKRDTGLKPKDLVGVPWRVAFALQSDGWTLRSDVIWHKPNCMPESVTDRPTKAHEYLFLLAKRERYYYDAEAVKEVVKRPPSPKARSYPPGYSGNGRVLGATNSSDMPYSALGRNRRSVWTIATTPYAGAHFAVMPEALVEPCILAGTSERGACQRCGRQWKRMTKHVPGDAEAHKRSKRTAGMHSSTSTLSLSGDGSAEWARRGGKTQTLGWEPGCTCGLEPVPAVVLDPFIGSGTVAQVAQRLGRRWLGCELNPDYEPLIEKRAPRPKRTPIHIPPKRTPI